MTIEKEAIPLHRPSAVPRLQCGGAVAKILELVGGGNLMDKANLSCSAISCVHSGRFLPSRHYQAEKAVVSLPAFFLSFLNSPYIGGLHKYRSYERRAKFKDIFFSPCQHVKDQSKFQNNALLLVNIFGLIFTC